MHEKEVDFNTTLIQYRLYASFDRFRIYVAFFWDHPSDLKDAAVPGSLSTVILYRLVSLKTDCSAIAFDLYRILKG